jgi:hypothetical protein
LRRCDHARIAVLHRNKAFLLALSIVAVSTAAWATQRPALYFSDYSGSHMSFTVGFGGIFFAGLIALSIGLPYRMSAAAGAARLSDLAMQEILALRLIVLPLFGFAGSLICLAIVRRRVGGPIHLRRPVRTRAARTAVHGEVIRN